MARAVSFITMGCAKNEVDSAHMAQRLIMAGYDIVDDPSNADVVVVNTCSFIQAATEESIEAILDAAELKNNPRLVVSGCMPARYEGELENELPEVGRFVPCSDEASIVAVVDELLGHESVVDIAERGGYGVPGFPLERRNEIPFRSYPYAYVKISDGCNRFCAYCTIPLIRGRYHSFEQAEIEREVRKLVADGVREIVLIAQDTGRWGDDFEHPSTLAQLVSHLAETFADTWFRIMYIQPEGVTDELIEAFAVHDNICSYFDIPFQHCSSSILKAMNRQGSWDEHMALIERIRTRIPDATLRTTLIAGFPGETEEQFEELCDFVEEAELDYVGVFPYSREEGTKAYNLPDQIDDDEKIARAQRIRDIADAVSGSVIKGRVGSHVDVLICGEEEDGQLFGRAQSQAPDVDGVTYVSRGAVGDIVRVAIEDTLVYEMEGEVIS